MKVLFAVNDENISASIVKKYQKQYKEIISYKNVYYFNAILKELKKNKGYDRVVISEDLEEFTSSSYEQKDKFIFNRLDSISDEAVSTNGSDIPIILICSERRHKSEDILIKLFGIGIYNAILGDDRTFEEVCKLIYKPRSKKEAKLYYKIDVDDVNYEKGSESDVKEEEMQNILMHFKSLGKNEDRYVESFNNIVSQYTDEQLKVIIAVLPNSVKAVLAANSLEYQRIAKYSYIGKKLSNKDNINETQVTNKKGPSNERLLDTESKTIMSKPVVVPTNIETNIYKKVNDKTPMKVNTEDIEDEEENINVAQQIEEQPRRKRGRPRKNPIVEEEKEEIKKEIKKRGRPRKNPVVQEVVENEEDEDDNNELLNILPGFDNIDEEENIDLPKYENVDNDNDDNNDYDTQDNDDINRTDYFHNNNYYSYNNQQEDYENDDDNNDDDDEQSGSLYSANSRSDYNNTQAMEKYDNVFEDGEIESLLSRDKKVMVFVGTSKNGTSFIVNSVAQILSNMGVNTAILDATKNKNSYYIYTNNDEDLRRIAVMSIKNLTDGVANGIKINNNLTVYTDIPSQYDIINNSHPILNTLIRNHSAILIDCDFNTPVEYFKNSQEIYLIQSMDVLTIQPLTEFLRELKVKNALEENKIRIILNKMLKLKRVDSRSIIGGMSKYNDPEMSFMTEIFDRNTVKEVAQIPFDEDVYIRYLQDIANCEIDINKYPKEFKARLNVLAGIIYPLLSSPNGSRKMKKETRRGEYNEYSNSFSSDMNNTLNNMRQKY